MATTIQPRVWFEVDPGGPIAGVMHVDGRPPRPFDSWLELVALIEQARVGGEARDHDGWTDDRPPVAREPRAR